MRHGKKINHLGRTSSHRKAMLSNMAISLIKHKKVTTTLAKAKALRVYVEPLLTKSKTDSTHSRRMVFAYLQDKEAVQILFDEIARKIADRPGGYTRILRTETRLGDAAAMCFIELVDYNTFIESKVGDAKKTRRSRRGKGTAKATETVAEVVEQPAAE
jgi:large subunit ribosomal protein L17